MNNTDVINMITEKTGVDAGTCGKVLEGVEENAGGSVMGKLVGKQLDAPALAAKIAGKIGVPADICEKVISALNDVLSKGLLDKINPFKK